jgi:hypothetical protein
MSSDDNQIVIAFSYFAHYSGDWSWRAPDVHIGLDID